jgi:hypothetical protein
MFLFCVATFAFAAVIWYAVQDVHELMKADFEELKKEQENVESTHMMFVKP